MPRSTSPSPMQRLADADLRQDDQVRVGEPLADLGGPFVRTPGPRLGRPWRGSAPLPRRAGIPTPPARRLPRRRDAPPWRASRRPAPSRPARDARRPPRRRCARPARHLRHGSTPGTPGARSPCSPRIRRRGRSRSRGARGPRARGALPDRQPTSRSRASAHAWRSYAALPRSRAVCGAVDRCGIGLVSTIEMTSDFLSSSVRTRTVASHLAPER